MTEPPTFPAHGRPAAAVLAALQANRHDDVDWRSGRAFSLVYHPDDPALEELLEAVSREYLAENALNPFAFPSLHRLERDVVAWCADLLHGADGTLTSGGTESIFLAVRVGRELAHDRGVEKPTLVTPVSAHPAFGKAAHLLGVEHVRVPLDEDHRVDLGALRDALDDRTSLVVASAPNYPYGVIDPVTEVAALAAERGLPCHVDACLGGMLLPFWERIGEPVPPWDLRVPGVTSLSADIHKYGYSYKGASVLLFADAATAFRTWWFGDEDWGGGIYGGPTSAGTRPAPPIAGAWAAIQHLGIDGYEAKARVLRDALHRLLAGLAEIPDLLVTEAPDLTVLEIGSATLDLEAVHAEMRARGWHLDRQPGGLHLMLSPYHARVIDELLSDLRESVTTDRRGEGRAATYGAEHPA